MEYQKIIVDDPRPLVSALSKRDEAYGDYRAAAKDE